MNFNIDILRHWRSGPQPDVTSVVPTPAVPGPMLVSMTHRRGELAGVYRYDPHPLDSNLHLHYRGWLRPGPLPPGGVEIEAGETLNYISGHYRIFQYADG